jgi:hypothetical protein
MPQPPDNTEAELIKAAWLLKDNGWQVFAEWAAAMSNLRRPATPSGRPCIAVLWTTTRGACSGWRCV